MMEFAAPKTVPISKKINFSVNIVFMGTNSLRETAFYPTVKTHMPKAVKPVSRDG